MSFKTLIDIDGLSDAHINQIIDRAVALSEGAAPRVLSDTVAHLFIEPSTRTRVSFDLAASRLGLNTVHMDAPQTSLTKGESLGDTLATLDAMGVNAVVLRHPETGICAALAQQRPAELRLINAGDGSGHHPTQALLDMATLRAAGVDVSQSRILIVGDLKHSRVARSNMALLKRLGVGELAIASPPEWLPEMDAQPPDVTIFDRFDEAIVNADVVMMLRVQRERMGDGSPLDVAAYHQDWGLTAERLRRAHPSCHVMHPGPINRGIEVTDDVADGSQSLILSQVRMSVMTRMAVFEAMLAES